MIHQTLFLLAQAASAAPQASPGATPGAGGGVNIFANPMTLMVLIFGVMYFLLIRPQSQKQKQQQAMISSLKTGDKVVTAGGIHGLISNVKETTVIVKVADNVKIEVDKSAVTGVTKRTEDDAAPASS
ncbi:MAG TPA: preprotein translocase subunit YajC [Chthoniobacteraceae bacterium]|nr:preprotein translocase subunit YajC [Chthoniobacteraceae bacterium]